MWMLEGFPNPGVFSIAAYAYQAGPGESQKTIGCTSTGACEIHVMARCGPSEPRALSRGSYTPRSYTPRA
jgi:hypothetical protein